MNAFLHEFVFDSKEHTYFKDFTKEINTLVKKSKVENGLCTVSSKHTTMGLVVQEIAEPNLLHDILTHTLHTVPEDKRSERIRKFEKYPHPTRDYTHRCQDNPYCDEIDEDYNAAAHIRSLTFSHSSVTVPIQQNKLTLGKYQQVAILELDGRDGTGKNPVRRRTLQVWIYPFDKVQKI